MLAQRVRVLEEPLRDIGSVQEDYAGRLKALVNQVADEGGADGIVIAGAPLAVLAGEIRNELAVPVIDGGSSAITRVEPKKATKGSFTHGPDARSNACFERYHGINTRPPFPAADV
jgi:Asp/Glu/hydantoin racemase